MDAALQERNGFDLFQDRAGGRCQSVTETGMSLLSEVSVFTVLGATGRKSALEIPAAK
jgi:hypothetical protein